MGDRSAISWCHCTFNPWWGCVEVSPACDFCYARAFAHRLGYEVWGKDAPRRFFGDEHWDQPMRWNRRAQREGIRLRVFCASMADVGEERDDAVGRELARCRQRLWLLIANTPNLDWLLLTKRPRLYRRLIPREILALPNVWPGVTVESPEHLWRADELRCLTSAGPVWISYEPALEVVDFDLMAQYGRKLDWIVVGCESRGAKVGRAQGYKALATDTLRQCQEAGVAFFHKQAPGVAGRVVHELGALPYAAVREFPR